MSVIVQPTLHDPTTINDDKSHHFRTDHLNADLGRHTARSGAVTIASQGFKFLISMAATVVLARLLSPRDYGLIGMVAVVTGFISIFKDMGLSLATIQQEEINQQQISTLFWINVSLSVGVMLLTAAIGPLVAWFYGEPNLTLITVGLAAGFLFGGLTVQHEALLKRQMRFRALVTIEIVSVMVGLIVGITLAWRGAGYWSLVANQLVQGLTYAIGVWIISGWRPGRPMRYSGVRSMLAIGGNLTGFHVVNYFARNLDNMLIGRFWGSASLGLYAKAYQLLLLPIDQINAPIAAVAVPALSRLTHSPERYRKAYLRILEKIAIVTMPGMAFMIATSDWIVRLVLGPKWMSVSPIFALLGIAGLVQPILNTAGWLYITQGRTRQMFHFGLIASTIIILSIVAGLPWGPTGVALAYSTTFVLVVTPLVFHYAGREGPVSSSDVYRTVAPFACASLFSLLVSLAFRRWSGIDNPLLGLAACLPVSAATALVTLMIIPAGKAAILDLKYSLLLLTRRTQMAGKTVVAPTATA
jgi:PST family polysaccharide transporter